MRQYPKLSFYVIDWTVPIRGHKVGFFLSFDRDNIGLSYSTQRHMTIADQAWDNVGEKAIHLVAKKRGTFQTFGRFGAKAVDTN